MKGNTHNLYARTGCLTTSTRTKQDKWKKESEIKIHWGKSAPVYIQKGYIKGL